MIVGEVNNKKKASRAYSAALPFFHTVFSATTEKENKYFLFVEQGLMLWASPREITVEFMVTRRQMC